MFFCGWFCDWLNSLETFDFSGSKLIGLLYDVFAFIPWRRSPGWSPIEAKFIATSAHIFEFRWSTGTKTTQNRHNNIMRFVRKSVQREVGREMLPSGFYDALPQPIKSSKLSKLLCDIRCSRHGASPCHHSTTGARGGRGWGPLPEKATPNAGQVLAGDSAASGGLEFLQVSSGEDADFERRVQEMKAWMGALGHCWWKKREEVLDVVDPRLFGCLGPVFVVVGLGGVGRFDGYLGAIFWWKTHRKRWALMLLLLLGVLDGCLAPFWGENISKGWP